MLYCFDKDLPWDYSKKEMEIANLLGICVLYDRKINEFIDFNDNIVDITGQPVLMRTGVEQGRALIEEITKHGGIPIISVKDADMVEAWPKYVSIRRGMEVLRGSELIDPEFISVIEKRFGQEIFLKTLKKNFNGVIPVKYLKDKDCAFYKAIMHHLEDEFIVSEKIDILEDEHGKKEYRCFVVGGEVYNISRMTTTGFHKIDKSILERLESLAQTLKGYFPDTYCVDLCEYTIGGDVYIDVVEFNPIYAAGPYLYNSCITKSKDLLHDDIKGIASEFMESIGECSMDEEYINDRPNLYDIKGGFSNDLQGICLHGSRGGWAHGIKLTVEDFGTHEPLFNLENAVPLTDDDLFKPKKSLLEELIEDGMPKDEAEKMVKLLNENKKG